MLVLTRKIGESIVISGGIVIRVLSDKSGRVRLGIEAPEEVSILRGELLTEFETSPNKIQTRRDTFTKQKGTGTPLQPSH